MKKIILLLFTISFTTALFPQMGAFKIRNDAAIQLGHNNYRYLTFGTSSSTPNNGSWSIENWDGGLNFWKPWPTQYYGNYKMFISDEGFVGINMRPNPSYAITTGSWFWRKKYSNFRLQISGRGVSHGWFTWSDESLKENVNSIDTVMNLIMSLKPVTYNYKSNATYGLGLPANDDDIVKKETINGETAEEPNNHDDVLHYGLLANDLIDIIPDIVSKVDSNANAVNYIELIPILVKATQEQQKTIETLKAEINKLEDVVESLNEVSKNSLNIDAVLEQNEPNPFSSSTTIEFEINSSFTNAKIVVYDFWGEEKQSYDIFSTGIGNYVIEANTLHAGTYHYALIIDKYVVDSKIMFLVK